MHDKVHALIDGRTTSALGQKSLCMFRLALKIKERRWILSMGTAQQFMYCMMPSSPEHDVVVVDHVEAVNIRVYGSGIDG